MNMTERLRFIYNEAAVVIEADGKGYLVVGDLHIGAERKFIKKGVRLYNTVEHILENLKRLAQEFNTKNIVILGDVKDTVLYPEKTESDEVKSFFRGLSGYNVTVTIGNHDPHLKEIVECNAVEELIVGDFALMHGHKWPSDEAMKSKYILVGHNHVAVSFRDKNGAYYTQKAWLVSGFSLKSGIERYPDANKKIKLVVLPAFNDLIVGMPVNEVSEDNLSPLFRNKIFNYNLSKVYSLRGDMLGTASSLKKKIDSA
jgi:uncharacterized protein